MYRFLACVDTSLLELSWNSEYLRMQPKEIKSDLPTTAAFLVSISFASRNISSRSWSLTSRRSWTLRQVLHSNLLYPSHLLVSKLCIKRKVHNISSHQGPRSKSTAMQNLLQHLLLCIRQLWLKIIPNGLQWPAHGQGRCSCQMPWVRGIRGKKIKKEVEEILGN